MVKWLFKFSHLMLLSTVIFMAGPLTAQDSNTVIRLWVHCAPGFENKMNEPEQAKDWWVNTINNPSLTVYLPPKEIATGAAVVQKVAGTIGRLVKRYGWMKRKE